MIVSPLASAIRNAVRRAMEPREMAIQLTGTQYGTFPVWTPKSAQGKLVVEVTLDWLGGTQCLLSDADDSNSNRMGWSFSSGKFYFDYLDTTGASKTVSVGGAGFVSVGVRNRVEVSFGAHGVTITANGVSSTLADRIDPADLNLVRLSGTLGGGNLANGTIHRCEFIDLSPLQNCRSMAGDGVSRYALTPAIPLAADFEIEWSGVFSSTIPTKRELFGHEAVFKVEEDTNNTLSVFFGNGSDWIQNHQNIAVNLAAGQHYTGKFVYTAATQTGIVYIDGVEKSTKTNVGAAAAINFQLSVYKAVGRGAYWDGRLGNIKITDLTTGKVYTYDNANDTGNKLVNSSDPTGATDGVWYQSGAVMTDAAANAARTLLPPINRTYDFADSIPTLPAASPLQLARVMGGGTATNRHAKVPNAAFSGDCDIYGWLRYTSKGSFSNIFAGARTRFSATGTNVSPVLRLDGTLLGSGGDLTGTTTMVDGQDYSYRVSIRSGVAYLYLNDNLEGSRTVTGTLNISEIGANYSSGVGGTDPMLGIMPTLYAHDLTTGKLYAWGGLNDVGNVLTNLSSVDQLGPNLEAPPQAFTSGSSAASVTEGEIYFFAPTNDWVSVGYDTIPAGLYRVSFDLEVLSGGVILTDMAESAVFSAAPNPFRSSGSYVIDANTPLGFRFKRDGQTSPDEVYIRNVSIRRIYSLATAEGADLWTLGAIPMLAAQTSLIQSSVFIEQGKAYRLEGVPSGVFGNDSAGFSVSNGQTFIASGTEGFRIRNTTSNAVGPFTPRLVPVTHGLWYEGDTAMTDDAANAARTYLPALPKRFAGSSDTPDTNGQNPIVWTGLTAGNIVEAPV